MIKREVNMYRIGEFSKITNLSIRTLRYYNDIGLLIPEEVDLFTNYRYYGKRNLEDVKIIKELKAVGFTLEEIRDNWNNFSEKMFIDRKEKLLKEIEQNQDSIKKLDKMRSKINNDIITECVFIETKKKSIF